MIPIIPVTWYFHIETAIINSGAENLSLTIKCLPCVIITPCVYMAGSLAVFPPLPTPKSELYFLLGKLMIGWLAVLIELLTDVVPEESPFSW
jgi:hypothetical protein